MIPIDPLLDRERRENHRLVERLAQEIRDLRSQRDELLAALKDALSVWCIHAGRLIEASEDRGREVDEAFDRVAAAIAKAKGSAKEGRVV